MSRSLLEHSTKSEPYHHGNLHATLLEAARALVEEVGIDGFSLRELSSHQAIQGITDPMQKLSALGVAYVVYAFDHPSEFRIMFRQELHSPLGETTNLEQTKVIAPDPAFVLLKQTLIECRDAGCVPISGEKALELASINMWALVHGLATLIIDGPLVHTIRTRDQVIELTRQITRGQQ
jgi:Tetracyclin repressor-like, C-terminal domain